MPLVRRTRAGFGHGKLPRWLLELYALRAINESAQAGQQTLERMAAKSPPVYRQAYETAERDLGATK